MNERIEVPEQIIQSAKANIVSVVQKYLALTKEGTEYKGLCPFHSETTPSFSVSETKEFYYCFGCSAQGDAIDFVMHMDGVGFPEAVKRIAGNYHAPDYRPPKARPRPKPEPEWVPVIPVPADLAVAPPDTFNRRAGDDWEKFPIAMRWAYRNASGELLGYVCRFERPDGGKETIPQVWSVNTKTGEARWRWSAFPRPRPLYGLDKLAAHPRAQVVVCEGEKTADAAQALYEAAGISRDKLVAVAWPGGANAIEHVNWEPLEGRAVGLWPDADSKAYKDNHPRAGEIMPFNEQPGTTAMVAIAKRLLAAGTGSKFIMPPEGVPDGWDLADELPAGFNLLKHTKASARLVDDAFLAEMEPGSAEPEPEPDPMPEPEPEPAQPTPPAGAYDDDELVKQSGFTILGYDGTDYFIFHHKKKQVMTITRANIGSDSGLIELTDSPFFWEANFSDGRGGFDKKAIAAWIFSTAHARGIYDPTRVRGRGAWNDKGRSVFHFGSHLSVDGEHVDVQYMQSGYVYPLGRTLPASPDNPLTDEEGQHLLEVAALARWSMPASAALMAGWVMLAPICGMLYWRPHIWITGGAGTGKTTLQKLFCGGLTRGFSIIAHGNSTEAGIRQELRCDALPVLVDEFESNNEKEKGRVENIMSMIRQTSSETQAKTLKGTISGTGMRFDVRSMFCLASINTNLPTRADVDRLSVLSLQTGGNDNWPKLESALQEIDRDQEISSRLLARALALMPVIRETIQVFCASAGAHFQRQRDGDQYGTLLAGAWCLTHSRVPSVAEALDYILSFDWSEHREDAADLDDAKRALSAILGAKLKVGTLEYTVYELIRESSPIYNHGSVDQKIAADTLSRHGIAPRHGSRVDDGVVVDGGSGALLIGTSVENLLRLVKDMPFVTNLRGQLLRNDGAQRVVKAVRFLGGVSKCVALPLAEILEDETAI